MIRKLNIRGWDQERCSGRHDPQEEKSWGQCSRWRWQHARESHGDTCEEAKETSVAAATEGRVAGREVGKDEATLRCLDFTHLQWNPLKKLKLGHHVL